MLDTGHVLADRRKGAHPNAQFLADGALLDLVLQDLRVHSPEMDLLSQETTLSDALAAVVWWPFGSIFQPQPSGIVFSRVPAVENLDRDYLSYALTHNPNYCGSPLEPHRIGEALASLADRMRERQPFRHYHPRDPRIPVSHAPRWDDPVQRVMGPLLIRAFAPGYSRDGALAVARLWFPWSTHHSGAVTYALVRSGQKWSIRHRLVEF